MDYCQSILENNRRTLIEITMDISFLRSVFVSSVDKFRFFNYKRLKLVFTYNPTVGKYDHVIRNQKTVMINLIKSTGG